MMALEREGTNLDGERGRLAAAQAQSGGKIAETQLQIIQIDQDLRSEVANSLREIEARERRSTSNARFRPRIS